MAYRLLCAKLLPESATIEFNETFMRHEVSAC